MAVLAYRTLPSTRTDAKRRVDWLGILVLGAMLVSLAYGVNQLDAQALGASLLSLRVWPALLIAALLLPVFVWIENRTPEPLLRLGLFQNRQVVLACLFSAGAGLTEAAFVFFPALAIAAFGVTKSTASYMLLPLVFAVAVGSPVAGRMLDRVGSRAVVFAGTLLLTLGLGLVGFFPTEKLFFYAGSVGIGLGLSCLLGSSINYILLNEARVSERTVAQGVSTLGISIGQLLGGALIGAVAASSPNVVPGFARAFLSIAVVAFLLVFLSLGLKRRGLEHAARAQQQVE